MTDDESRKYIQALMLKLSEHFDNCQIFLSKNPKEHATEDTEAGDTTSFTDGFGNWFARVGQVHQWSIRQDERVCCNTRKDDE